ncbi:MAG: aminomethyl-transferring glycine dehydrogenase [Calditrichaceae bacterium]|nr:aminomethyl-transferring glycine dehydrogenase [Calditrichia bacterium]NUQ41896.1 aminomethyl-transferring glycine dehydrogenase [Calditrichaceae bacterium]
MHLDQSSKSAFPDQFSSRHIGISASELSEMLQIIGCDSLETLLNETVPKAIRLKEPLNLPEAISEAEFLRELKKIAQKNKTFKSFIGMGYYGTILPTVIARNIFENPGWYTAYTPYQAEIAQGRLEALLNFQTMVADLTGMEIANASLLDEGTAAAEAMSMMHRARSPEAADRNAHTFFVSDKCFPQTIDVLRTRAKPLGIQLQIGDAQNLELNDRLYGILLQFPDADGSVADYSALIEEAHKQHILVAVAADLLSLALLTPPGEIGADVVFGSAQRFGVPRGFGGPHAAFFAARDAFKRHVPGRVIGVSIDRRGKKAYRMALQTREQHIRREKATSNICTAQTLLANMASMYAVYHGPEGLKAIARRIHKYTRILDIELTKLGFTQANRYYFDTLKIAIPSPEKERMSGIQKFALETGMNFRYIDSRHIGISFDELVLPEDIQQILRIFARSVGKESPRIDVNNHPQGDQAAIPKALQRRSEFMAHPVFHQYHTETKMLRYIKSLENRDLSLTISMIPLGSCTMKLNATTELIPVIWPEFSHLHPFIPRDQAEGYHQMFAELESMLCEITGLEAVSLQPNSGAQGEFTGMMVIRAYHEDRGQGHRNVALIPSSAHGTNPASAVMAGMEVVIVKCDDHGNIDLADLQAKAQQHANRLAALMVTYPSTHGVFEEDIKEICEIVHQNGGQVYMDGANMNAQVGLTKPGIIGADVCHLNLHKTFSIPHGGGGPGMGPICVAGHLAPYLPGHVFAPKKSEKALPAVSSTHWGSANILVISYGYIKMLGKEGVKKASEYAILNANYIKSRLEKYYPVLYTGKKGRVGHELIFDCRPFKQQGGIEVEDIAKRLMDYGFHAPTVSFPVIGTLMVEPTESESKDELDRFCDAMISIYEEIQEVLKGIADPLDNVLKNAPHTAEEALSDNWTHPYSREKAVYPLPYLREHKFWPAVARIDNAYGDRNLVCTCPPVEEYLADEEK